MPARPASPLAALHRSFQSLTPRLAVTAVVPALILTSTLVGCGGPGDDETATPRTTDDLAYADKATGDATSVSGESPGDTDDPDRFSPPTTEGSGLPPVTTILVAPGGDPAGIYRGEIGSLTLAGDIVPAVVSPPRTEPGHLPLTGLPGRTPDRAAAVVKIDNDRLARPHTGLNAADIVFEEEVEGGVTRFAAVFHSRNSIVGPVRSARTTDLTLISSLGVPLLLYSGATDITEGILRSHDHIQNRSVASSSGYWRDESRTAPSNLYTDTEPHWASAEVGAPPAQFAYRRALSPAQGDPAEEFVIDYGANRVEWRWSGDQWRRYQDGEPHLLVDGDQVRAANVVVIEARRVDTGMMDASGGAVPEFPYVGTGSAVVFTDESRIEGVWTRPSLGSVATLTDDDGEMIELTPGRTWVQIVDIDTGVER